MVLPNAWNGFYQRKNRSNTSRQRTYTFNKNSCILQSDFESFWRWQHWQVMMQELTLLILPMCVKFAPFLASSLDLITLTLIAMIRYIPMGIPKLYWERLSNSITCHATRSWSWLRYVYYFLFICIINSDIFIGIGVFYGRTRICHSSKFWWQWWLCQSAWFESKGMKSYTAAQITDIFNVWSYIVAYIWCVCRSSFWWRYSNRRNCKWIYVWTIWYNQSTYLILRCKRFMMSFKLVTYATSECLLVGHGNVRVSACRDRRIIIYCHLYSSVHAMQSKPAPIAHLHNYILG